MTIPYKAEIADELCAKLAQGKSVARACQEMDKAILVYEVFVWLRENPEFRKAYETAKQEAMDAMAEDILDIADDARNDFTVDENGTRRVDYEAINRSRLRVDTRKWLMSKYKPKKYGDHVNLTGEMNHTYVAQPIPVEQRNSDRAVARPNGATTNGHSAG